MVIYGSVRDEYLKATSSRESLSHISDQLFLTLRDITPSFNTRATHFQHSLLKLSMRLSVIFSLLAFGASFASALALDGRDGPLCCSECPKRLQKCIDDCVTKGSSKTYCSRGPCTGVVVGFTHSFL